MTVAAGRRTGTSPTYADWFGQPRGLTILFLTNTAAALLMLAGGRARRMEQAA